MNMFNHEFTDADRALLNSYVPLLECIGAFWGEYCEVVLHSFENLDSSVIFIANGNVTGRKLGSPVTNYVLEKLRDFEDKKTTFDIYSTRSANKVLKSASTLIINPAGVPVGMICINFALDMPLSELCRVMSAPCGFMNEHFTDDVNQLVLSHLDPIKARIYSSSEIPSKNRNFEIIRELNESGLFDLPITLKLVSESLGISQSTVYKHLRTINAAGQKNKQRDPGTKSRS